MTATPRVVVAAALPEAGLESLRPRYAVADGGNRPQRG
jgi:hypothetical protein